MPERLSAERPATDVRDAALIESGSLDRLVVSVRFCLEDAVGYELRTRDNEPFLIVANSSCDVEEDLHDRPQAHHAEPYDPTVPDQLEARSFRPFAISTCRLLCMNDVLAHAAQRRPSGFSIGMQLRRVSMFTIDLKRTPE